MTVNGPDGTTGEFCDHFVEVEGDPFAGTYCKLPTGHGGRHSAHYPELFGRCLGCRAPGPGLCGGCGSYIDDRWDGRVNA